MSTEHQLATTIAASSVSGITTPEATITALRQEMEALRAEVASLRAMMAPVQPAEAYTVATNGSNPDMEESSDSNSESGADGMTSRRDLLKWGGLGAAAAFAAAGGVAMTTPTAHAADGDSLMLGQSNAASHKTTLDGNAVSSGPVFVVLATTNFGSAAISGAGGPSGIGVLGIALGSPAPSEQGAGVLGQSLGGNAVGGQSETGMDLAAIGTGRLWQKPSVSSGAPAVGTHYLGEQLRDSNGDLYICVAEGLPGTWKKVAALNTSYKGGAIGFLSTPIRVYDSRSTDGALVGNATRAVQVTGVNIGGVQVPAGATGCIGNLTVTGATAAGYVVIYPAGSSTPTSSTVNFQSGQTVANAFAVGLSGSGQVTVHSFTSGSVHFILDITGFVA